MRRERWKAFLVAVYVATNGTGRYHMTLNTLGHPVLMKRKWRLQLQDQLKWRKNLDI